MPTKISLIAAMDLNRGIGYKNSLPWNVPIKQDWEHLFKVTKGYKMIMGRKSFDNPHRVWSESGNIVLSKNTDYELPAGFDLAKSLDIALETIQNEEKIFIIGGEEVFNQSIQLADEIFLTIVKDKFESDTFFPNFDEKKFDIEYTMSFNEDLPFEIEIIHFVKKK